MSETTKVRIWDIPTRLFHWALVLLVCFSWFSAKKFWMELHFLSGEAILALVLFRIVWGLVGSDTARFARFLKSPLAAIAHLCHIHRREPDREIGHNAAGGWMVIVLLLLLLAQVSTGFVSADDDAMIEGPLRHLVSMSTSSSMTNVHSKIFSVIEIAVLGHVCAIVVYLVLKGHNLVRPMILGTKDIEGPVASPRLASPILAAAVLAATAALVAAVVRFL